jgi:hypothetical protein
MLERTWTGNLSPSDRLEGRIVQLVTGCGWIVKLTTRLHVVPKLRTGGTLPPNAYVLVSLFVNKEIALPLQLQEGDYPVLCFGTGIAGSLLFGRLAQRGFRESNQRHFTLTGIEMHGRESCIRRCAVVESWVMYHTATILKELLPYKILLQFLAVANIQVIFPL